MRRSGSKNVPGILFSNVTFFSCKPSLNALKLLVSRLHGFGSGFYYFMKSILGRAPSKKLLTIIAASILLSTAAPVRAAFHLWTLSEIYSDASGSLQFIELVDNVGSQNSLQNQVFHLNNSGSTITHSFTFPSSISADPVGTHLLLGTAGLQAAGGPTPDFIIPNNFIFTAGGSISFFNASGPFSALPTDGNLSFNFLTASTGANTPENSAGQIGHVIVVPEPASAVLLFAGAAAFALLRRKIG